MPLRRASIPELTGMRLYRRVDYGDLVSFNVLDTRQYRDTQASRAASTWHDPRRTLTGVVQERWLLRNLERSRARWNVLAQQVFFARRDREPGPGGNLMRDAWDGYPAARRRITTALASPVVSNPIVLSGDVHSAWANDLLADYRDPESQVVGSEFVASSITSGGDGTDQRDETAGVLAENPHIKFFNGQRGYVRCRVTEREWRTDYRAIPFVSREGAGVATRASIIVEDGDPGLKLTAERGSRRLS